MKTTLMILALNECESMKVICPQIDPSWVDEIIVVDGHSTDGSYEYAKSLGWKTIRQTSPGMQQAYHDGLQAAAGDVIIPFSPDGNSLAEKIPPLVEKMKEGYDMVIVSRYLGGAKSEDDSAVTAFGNWAITTLINVLFGGHYTDSCVMFRGFKKTLIRELGITNNVCGWEPQLSIECARKKKKVGEIPGDEPPRLYGERKMEILKASFAIGYLIMTKFFISIWEDVLGNRRQQS